MASNPRRGGVLLRLASSGIVSPCNPKRSCAGIGAARHYKVIPVFLNGKIGNCSFPGKAGLGRARLGIAKRGTARHGESPRGFAMHGILGFLNGNSRT
jgi:hypothetical protein